MGLCSFKKAWECAVVAVFFGSLVLSVNGNGPGRSSSDYRIVEDLFDSGGRRSSSSSYTDDSSLGGFGGTLASQDSSISLRLDFFTPVGEEVVELENQAPTISAIQDQIIPEDSQTTVVSFTVGDEETGSADLVVTRSSSNPILSPPESIVLGGSHANRTLVITPAPNRSGSATITVTVSDGSLSAVRVFVLTVNSVNDDPVISEIENQTSDEDVPTAEIAFTIGDVETTVADLVVTGNSSNESVVPQANIQFAGTGSERTVRVTPAINAFGTTTITVAVNDGTKSVNEQFIVSFTGVNDAPSISEIANQETAEDTPTSLINFTVGDVETDVSSLTLTGSSLTPALVPNENIVLNGSGSSRTVVITPANNQSGTTTITITVEDQDGTTASESFLLTVAGGEDLPTISAIADQETEEDTPTASVSFTVGDAETDPASLTVSGSSADTQLVPIENITLDGNGADRTVVITPGEDQTGTTAISLTVSDGIGSTTVSFNLTVTPVNDPPTVSEIPRQEANEDTAKSIGFTIADVDDDPVDLTVSGSSSIELLVPQENLEFGGTGSDRTIVVTPLEHEFGTTTITITVSDGTVSSSSSFAVTFIALNDVPTISTISDQETAEDTATGSISFTVGDIETAAADLTISGSSSTTSLVADENIVFGGSGSDRTLVITPEANQSGSVSITITVEDEEGESSNETFLMTVTGSEDLPTISTIADQTTDEDTSTSEISFTIGDVETAAEDLTVTGSSADTELVPEENIELEGSGADRTVVITPAEDEFGTAIISLSVSDGSGSTTVSFELTVTSVNDEPTISTISDLETAEDTATGSISFTVGDIETAAADLTVTGSSSTTSLVADENIVFGGNGSDRTLVITPEANQSGSASITITVEDEEGGSSSETFLLTVTGGEDLPTISTIADQTTDEDTSTSEISFTISDVETAVEDLVVTGSSADTELVPEENIELGGSGADRTVVITPAEDEFGRAIISLSVSDGSGSTTVSFELAVTSVNDEPTISTISDQETAEDTATGSISFTVGDIETAAADLTISGSSSTTSLVADENIVFSGSEGDRTLVITPESNQFGSTTITITVEDEDGGSSSETFLLAVTPGEDLPTITPIADQTTNEDTSTAEISFTVSDAETAAEDLVVTGSSSDTELVPDENIEFEGSGADRTVSITPAADEFGTTSISLSVSDGSGSTTVSFELTVTAVNDAPTISTISDQETAEDTATGSISFTLDDVETAAANLTVTGSSSTTSLVPDGNIVFSGSEGDRTLVITPASNQSGSVSITITVEDADGGSSSETFLLTVTGGEDLPTISAVADQTTNEDTSTAEISFTVSDVETAAEDLTVSGSSSDTELVPDENIEFGGSGADRTVSITPAEDEFGTTPISLSVSDGSGSTTVSFELTVTAVNDAPTISTISDQETAEDTATGSISFTVGDVDTSAANLTVSGSSSNEDLVLDEDIEFGGSGTDRTVVITPVEDEFGTATITLIVSDGTDSVSESFDITVTSVNDEPTISTISDQETVEDTSSGLISFTVGDLETEAEDLTVSAGSSTTSLVPDENIEIGGSGSARTIVITPASNQSGSASITITVEDEEGGSSSETFLLTVTGSEDLPTISVIVDQTIDEDASTPEISFTISDVETAAENLVVTGRSSDTELVPDGNIEFGGSEGDRTVSITPAADEVGTASISLSVSDGSGSTTVSFELTVNPVNDAPTISEISDQATDEDEATDSIEFTVGDVETNEDSLTITGSSSNEDLVLDEDIELGGSGTDRTVVITPIEDEFGTATITLIVSDGTDSVSESFDITVTSVNDEPTISAIADQETTEDTSTGSISFTVSDLETAAADLTVITSSSDTTLVPNENVTVGGDGTDRTVTVAPAEHEIGVATITITVGDGVLSASESFEVTVEQVNDVPTITEISDQSIDEDSITAAIGFTITDVETSVDDLTVSGDSSNLTLVPEGNIEFEGSGVNRTVVVSPAEDEFGIATITVTVNDGTEDVSESFDVVVTAVNDVPTISAVADQETEEDVATAAISFTVGDVETAEESLTVTAESSDSVLVPVSNIAVGGDGIDRTLTITPAENEIGSATITVIVNDGELVASESFVLSVSEVNDAPTISAIVDQEIDEDSTTQSIGFTVGDLETEAANLNVNAVSSDTAVVTESGIAIEGEGAERTVAITPVPDQFGNATITLNVSDGSLTTSTSFEVTVSPLNDAPTITVVATDSTEEDTTKTISFTVADAETFAENLVLSGTSSNLGLVPNANLLFDGSGSDRTVTITLAANQHGSASISIAVTDGEGEQTVGQLDFTVNPVNDVPVAEAQTVVTDQNVGKLITIEASDVETDPLTFTVLTQPAKGILTGTVPNLTYTPNANETGTDSFNFKVSDGTTDSDPATVQIVINAISDLISINPIADQTTNEDDQTQIDFAITLNGTIVGGLSVGGNSSNTELVPKDNLVIGGTDLLRTVTITPAANHFGETTVTVTAFDESGNTTSRSFVLTVTVVNDAPTATAQSAVTLEDQSISIRLEGEDIEQDPLSFQVVTLPTFGELSGTVPNLIYTPAADANGVDSFTFLANDGAVDSVAATVSLQIDAINDPPALSSVVDQSVLEDSEELAVELIGISAGPVDEVQVLEISASSDNEDLTGVPIVEYTSPSDAAIVKLTPVADAVGKATITLRVRDDGGTNQGGADSVTTTFEFAVTEVNDPPRFDPISDQTIAEDSGELTINLSGISAGPSNETQTIAVIASSDDGILIDISGLEYTSPNSTGVLRLAPAANQTGEANILVTVTDDGETANGGIDTSVQIFEVTVTAENDSPTISAIVDQQLEEDGKSGEINFRVNDVEEGLLTVSVESSNTTLIESSGIELVGTGDDRTMLLTPIANQTGTAEITLTVTDLEGGQASETFTLSVGAVNDLPTIGDISDQVIDEDSATGTILYTVQDVETSAEVLELSGVSSDQTLVADTGISLSGTGETRSVQITPVANAFGSANITVSASDEDGGITSQSFGITVIGINDAPEMAAVADQSLEEDANEQTIDLTAISLGPENENSQTLTLSATSSNAGLIADPTIQYTSPSDTATLSFSAVANESGIATLTVLLEDDGGIENGGVASVEVSFQVTVNPVNDAPVMGAVSNQLVNEDDLMSVNANATDVENGNLTFSLEVGAPEGASIDPVSGVLSWTPEEIDGPGSVEITVGVTDDGNPSLSDTQSFTVTVGEINVSPSINSIPSQTVDEGGSIGFSIEATDSDIPANGLSFSLGGSAPAGASLSSGGFFSWSPGEADGPGSYSISVQVADDGAPALSASQSFSVTVNEVNQAPVLSAIGSVVVDEGNAVSVQASASDPDFPAQALSYSLSSGAPSGASINSGTGEFSWTPAEGEGPGSYSLSIVVSDSGSPSQSSSQSFSITVNEVNVAPFLAAIADQTAAEGSTMNAFVAGADLDLPSQQLTFSLGAGAPSGVTIDPSSGVVTWTPDESHGGAAHAITVVLADNGAGNLSSSQSFEVNVLEVDSSPVIEEIGDRSVRAGNELTLSIPGSDPDLPAETLTYSFPFGGPSGASIDPTSGLFTWTPDPLTPAGPVGVTVQVSDSGSPQLSVQANFTVEITAGNSSPSLQPISDQSVNEGELLTVNVSGSDVDEPAQELTYSLEPGAPAGVDIDSQSGALTWTPSEEEGPGSYPVTVRVTDDGVPVLSVTESFTVVVEEVNQPPTLDPIADQTVLEGDLLSVSVTATDPDSPANSLSYSLEAVSPQGASIDPTRGLFTWTPAVGQVSSTVSVQVNDNGTPNLSAVQTFNIAVEALNRAPQLAAIADQSVDEGTSFSLAATATDEDLPAQTLTYSLTTAPSGMQIDPATGIITWTPTEEQGPSDNPVTVEVTDSGTPPASGTQSFNLVVNEVNQAPVLAAISDQAVVFGNTLSISAQATDTDFPSNNLAYSLEAGAPTGATIEATTGLLEWTPSTDQADASHGFTLIVQDDATPVPGEASQSFTVTVASSNTAPELGAVADQTANEGELLAFTVTGTDNDVPAQPLLYELVGDVPPGAQIDSLTGEFTWTPTEEQGPAAAQITVQVSDSVTPPLSATSTFTVTINEVNQAPVVESVSNESVTVNEEEAVSVTIAAIDLDVPANSLTYSLGAGALEGASIDPSSGVFSWIPSKAQGPSDNTIAVVITDDGTPSLSAEATFTVVVNEINSPPTLAAIGDQTVVEGEVLTFTVAGSDTDVPAQELSYSLALGAPEGAAIDPITGDFSWTSSEVQGPFTGTISVRVTDNGTPIGRSSQDVNITVEEANTAPVLSALSDQIVSVGDTLTVEAAATDVDLPANALQFSIGTGAPAGAVIDTTSGVFTWTPTVDQVSPGTSITIVVTDDGPGTLFNEQSFNVEVKEGVNLPPALSAITDQTVPENGSTPGIAFTLTDADTPLENLRFTVSSSNPDLVPEGNIVISGAGENRTVQVTPVADQSGSATITLSVSEPAGGQASTSFALTVAPLPPAFVSNLPAQVEVLVGGTVDLSVTVSGSQPITYLWTKDGAELPGETGAVLALSDVTVEAAGSYSVSAENTVGAVNSDSTQVNVIVPLRIVDQPVGQKVLVGADVSFGVSAVGEPPLTYQWFAEGAEIPGATGETLSLGSVEGILAGNYTVIVSNTGGSVTSTAAVLEVIAPIQITVQPQGQTSVVGESASLSVTATGSEPIAYQWQFNGVDIGGETQATLNLANLTPNNTGEYAVVVSNEGGSVTSSAATLAVSTPPAITQQPQGQEVLAGTPASFEVTVSGTEPLTYQWQFNGAPIDGATARSLSITDVTVDTAGDYAVTVTNGAGSVSSDAATLVVVQPVVITAEPQDQTVTAGQGASFNVTVTGTDPLAYEWQFGGVTIDGATEGTLSLNNVQAADAGAYQVVVSNIAGPVSSAAATLTVNVGVAIVDQPQSVTVTTGDSATFTVLASGTPAPTYQWRLDGTDLTGATGPSLSVSNVTLANAGAYSVVVQNAVDAVNSADAVLAVIIPPSIQTQPQSQTVDLGAGVTFNVVATGDAPLSYQWQKNGGNITGATAESFTIGSVVAGDSGSYGVVIENPGGAVTSDSAGLTVNLPPIDSGNSAATAPPPIEDSSGSFDGGSNASGGGQIARRNAPPATGGERWYSWRAPGTGIATFDTAGSTFDTVLAVYTGTADALTLIASDDDRGGFLTSEVRFNATAGTTYLISVQGFGNAVGQIVVSFDLVATSQQLPVLTNSPQSVAATVGSDVSFVAVATGTDLVYQWLGNGTEIPGETGPTLQLTNVQEADALSYSVRVTSTTVVANPVSVESLPALLHIGTVNSLSADKFLEAPRLTGGVALQSAEKTERIELRSLRAAGAVVEGFSGALAFSTFGATKEQGEPNHCDVVGGASRWITYVAPEDGVVRITTEGSEFDTVLGVYSGGATSFASLRLEACDNDSGGNGRTSAANVRVTAGNQYFIAIDGVGGATGLAKLNYEFATGPAIATQPEGVSVSVGEQVVFFVQTADPVAGATAIEPSYRWTKDGFPIPGQTANNLIFAGVTLSDSGEYRVIVSNFAGSTTSETVRLDVSVPLALTTQPVSQSVAGGDPISFSVVASGSDPISYQWQLNRTDVPGATARNYSITSAQTGDEGSYTVVVSNPIGTVTSDAATLSLRQVPTVNVAPRDVAVVIGGQATLTVEAIGTGTLSYQWRFNGVDIVGATEPSLVLSDVRAENAGDYTVVVSNEAGSVISTGARVSVEVPFAIVEQPQSQALAKGSTAVFTVRLSGSGPFSYQWRVNDADLPGATEATLVLVNVQAVDAASYTVAVTDGAEQLVSEGALLSVSSLPMISVQPQGGVFFAGQEVTFSVAAAGSGAMQYQWLLDGEPLVGATEAELILTNIGLQAAGNYSVIASNNAGSVGSELGILTVREIVSQVTKSTGVNAPPSEFSFRVSVPPGNQARVQVSTDLLNWNDLTPTPVTGIVDIFDPDSVSVDLRFYRVIVEAAQ